MQKKTNLKNFIIVVFLSGCSSASQDVYENHNQLYTNTLPEGGVLSEYTNDQGFINLEEMKNSLKLSNRAVFDTSVSWYATESEFSFTRISNKSAKEIVDIVNCLKSKRLKNIKERATCF